MKPTLLLAWLLLLASLAHAGGQTVIPDYATEHRDFFWTQLYSNGGRSLYCNVRFEKDERLTVEHTYPADWIATHHGCPNRNECPIPSYGFAEADLHNLWPAIGAINSSRGDKLYGEIPGNTRTLPPSVSDLNCDYERTTGANAVVEPRDAVKGGDCTQPFLHARRVWVGLAGYAPYAKAVECWGPTHQQGAPATILMAGSDPATVSRLMGHTNLAMRMGYAHLSHRHESDAVAKLDAKLTQTRNISENEETEVIEIASKQAASGFYVT